ncbi:MAG: ankyrin repeat domain-containing protein [Gammaproteobacteria bacterium]
MEPNEIWRDVRVRELAIAGAQGDLSKIEDLVESGVDINSAGEFGATPIWWSIQRQNKAGYLKMLELGADPNKVWSRSGRTFTYYVATLGDSYYLEQALKHGANPNQITNTVAKTTPLYAAASHPRSHVRNTKLLIDFDADVNVKNSIGETPLMFALLMGRFDTAYLLVEAGTDLTVRQTLTDKSALDYLKGWRDRRPEGFSEPSIMKNLFRLFDEELTLTD